MIHVRHLFISPGHNYVGHHGQTAGEHSIIEVDQVECVAGQGLRGDRFFAHEPDFKGQITFFAREVFEQLRVELGLPPEMTVAGTRRNVITEGTDLAAWVGCEFEVQGVRFAGTEECRPCYWMNNAFRHADAEAWLAGRGGLRARILSDGILRREVVP